MERGHDEGVSTPAVNSLLGDAVNGVSNRSNRERLHAPRDSASGAAFGLPPVARPRAV